MLPLTVLKWIITRLWRADRPLTVVAVLMVGVLAACGIGLIVDDRTITGAPAWLKPAKFAASTAIYSATLAWIFSYLRDWPRLRGWVSWTTGVVFVLEIAIVDLQAWRGTTSHFNVGTPLDTVLFAIMGTAIATQTIASAFVVVALWRQSFEDRVMATALRAGMLITVIGASSGGLMTTPTDGQIENMHATQRMTTSGAHTVGGPDGGAGLIGTGWSTEHGDLRIPHFLGLHAVQLLPALALLVRRRRTVDRSVATLRAAAWSYVGLFGILLLQALRGEALLSPGPVTLGVIAAWAVISGAAVWATGRDWHAPMAGTSMMRA
jgi:hypothetical protein